MKPTLNKALPCAVVGHNYTKSKTNSDHTYQLTCNHCGIITNSDQIVNFEESSISNKDILSTLKQLFHLKLQLSKSKLT